MSREIKFRAWVKQDNEWFYTYLDIEEDDFCGNEIWLDYDKCATIEQYTGLKDKNGKEIYEGDILWWEHFYGMTGENIETTAKVYWEEKDASFVVGDWFEPLGHLVDEDEIEVIGNIHENPELLEDK